MHKSLRDVTEPTKVNLAMDLHGGGGVSSFCYLELRVTANQIVHGKYELRSLDAQT